MDKKLVMDALGWGVILWCIGYVLGIALFMLVPATYIGWILTPIGTLITIWVLLTKVRGGDLRYYLYVGAAWAAIAILCDYVFLMLLFHPADGYYKLDVYIYYVLTFLLPIVVGFYKNRDMREY